VDDKRDIRVLCPKCLREYRDMGIYYIRPVFSAKKEKEPCTRCQFNLYGYDYELIPKKLKEGRR
jgi:hypothetical protein